MPSIPSQIRKLLETNIKLASPPELFLRLSEILDDPSKNIRDASYLIEHDPALSARLLKLVNSPFYGFASKMTSIYQAISIIGVEELHNLVLTTLVVDKFSTLPNPLMSMREFWRLSVRCALTAKLLAHHHPEGKQLKAVFICGLLHEIGRLVMYNHLPEAISTAILLAKSENISNAAAEQKVIGFDHYQVGAELARMWCLPDIIAVTIESHHAPEMAKYYPQESTLIVFTQLLVETLMADPDSLDAFLGDHACLWESLALERVGLNKVLLQVETQFQDIFRSIYPH